MERNLPTLNDAEARVLGVLIEKALTTPDQYPLSINATRNGCNQKSNRFPATSFVEAEVVVALQGLVPKHLAGRVIGAGGRVEKFRHTADSALQLDNARLCILAELLMRGPQTPGELRARVHRMVPTEDLAQLNERLQDLIDRQMVTRVSPAPGSRTGRVMQTLAPDLHVLDEPVASTGGGTGSVSMAERVHALEEDLADLRSEFEALRGELGD